MKLSELAEGRRNNFNLIRIAAAFAVLFSHSFILTAGSFATEPLHRALGLIWGDVGVDVFFVTSGFLITSSLLTRGNAIDFLWARGLRIYPALWVMLVLTVFALGPALTDDSLRTYFTSRITWHFMLRNAFLFKGVGLTLPGVFETAPIRSLVNFSLWTLPREVWLYLLLLLAWIASSFTPKHRLAVLLGEVVAAAAVAGTLFAFIALHSGALGFGPGNDPRLAFMFFTGASLYLLKDKIELNYGFLSAIVILLALSTLSRIAFFFAFNFALAYLVLFFAYSVRGPILTYNRLGDYSYGVYIYSWPVQQSLVTLVPGISPLVLLPISASISLMLAALSWHLLEKHALRLKTTCAIASKHWLQSLGHYAAR